MAIGGARPNAPLLVGTQPNAAHESRDSVPSARLAHTAQRHRQARADVGAPARLEQLPCFRAQPRFGHGTLTPGLPLRGVVGTARHAEHPAELAHAVLPCELLDRRYPHRRGSEKMATAFRIVRCSHRSAFSCSKAWMRRSSSATLTPGAEAAGAGSPPPPPQSFFQRDTLYGFTPKSRATCSYFAPGGLASEATSRLNSSSNLLPCLLCDVAMG